jgi:hypothetical protein
VRFNAPTLKYLLEFTPSWMYIYHNGISSLFHAYTWSLDVFVDFAWWADLATLFGKLRNPTAHCQKASVLTAKCAPGVVDRVQHYVCCCCTFTERPYPATALSECTNASQHLCTFWCG